MILLRKKKYIKNTVKNIARREGRIEGISEGQKAEKEAIALKLLKANYPTDEIIKITDLTKEQIDLLQK